MAYNQKGIKLYYKLDTSVFINEVDTEPMTLSGTPTIATGRVGSAWQMDAATYASTDTSLAITNAFSIGFWLKPRNPGVGSNGTSLVPLKMPILVKGSIDDSGSGASVTDDQFMIWEETQEDGTNNLAVFLNGDPDDDCLILGTGYSTDEWHHFVIVYNVGTFAIYVDGSEVGTSPSDLVPSSLAASTSNLYVNRGPSGSSYELVKNTGVLDELFIANQAITSSDVTRIYTLGAPSVFESTLTSVIEVHKTATFSDPGTISANAVTSDGSDIFVGYSDGKLVKGHKSVWQSRRSFGSSAEAEILTKDYGPSDGDNAKYTINKGVLTIKNILVKL